MEKKCVDCKHFGELNGVSYCFLMTSARKEEDSCKHFYDRETAEVEVLYGHRKDTTKFYSGEELKEKALESFRARKEHFRRILDGE